MATELVARVGGPWEFGGNGAILYCTFRPLLFVFATTSSTALYLTKMSFAGRRRGNKVKKGVQFTVMVVGKCILPFEATEN